MARCIFRDDFNYGEIVREYYVDQAGPYVIESRYEIVFRGMGDYIGEPGPLKETRQYPISFSQLREAAGRAKASAYLEIDETNWQEVLRAAKPVKRKREFGTG